MLELAVKTLLAYLLGSVAGALALGQLLGFDIRHEGSGNAGATNALRTRGARFAAGTLLIDLGKGWVACVLVPLLPWPAFDASLPRSWLAVACAGAVVVGHVYPVWYGFRGGQGAATLLGALAGLCAGYVLPVLAVWLGVLWLTGYVGLATMLAAASFLLFILAGASLLPGYPAPAELPALTAFGALATAFTVYTHRANINRMLAGTENRARRFVRKGAR